MNCLDDGASARPLHHGTGVGHSTRVLLIIQHSPRKVNNVQCGQSYNFPDKAAQVGALARGRPYCELACVQPPLTAPHGDWLGGRAGVRIVDAWSPPGCCGWTGDQPQPFSERGRECCPPCSEAPSWGAFRASRLASIGCRAAGEDAAVGAGALEGMARWRRRSVGACSVDHAQHWR